MNNTIKTIIGITIISVTVLVLFLFIRAGEAEDGLVEAEDLEVTDEALVDFLSHVGEKENLLLELEEPMDQDSFKKASIQVLNEAGEEVQVSYELLEDKQTLRLLAPEAGYSQNELYEIKLGEGLRLAGEKEGETQSYFFKTAREEVEEASYRSDLIFLSKEDVLSLTDDKVTLTDQAASELEPGDVLVVPARKNDQEIERGIKITAIDQKDDHYLLSYTSPTIEEMYESINIFGSYDIEESHIYVTDPDVSLSTAYAHDEHSPYASLADDPLLIDSLQDHPFRREIPQHHNRIYSFSLDEKEISIGGVAIELSGDLRLARPYIQKNIDFNLTYQVDKIVDLDVILNLAEELEISTSIKTELAEKDIDLANLDEELRIGFIKVPLPQAPGIFFEMEIILHLETDVNGELTISTAYRTLNQYGVSYQKGELKFIRDLLIDYHNHSVSGGGRAKASFEIGLFGGLTALDNTSIGLEGRLGLETEARGHIYNGTVSKKTEPSSANVDREDLFAVCGEGKYGLYLAFNLTLGFGELISKVGSIFNSDFEVKESFGKQELSLNKERLRFTFLKHTFLENKMSNCVQLLEIVTDSETISLKNDHEKNLDIYGRFIDLPRARIYDKKFSRDELKLMVEDENIATASLKDGELQVKTATEPSGRETNLTLEYLGTHHIDANPSLDLVIDIKNYDDLNPLVKTDNKPGLEVDLLEEESIFIFSGSHEGETYKLYFYDPETSYERLDLPSFLGNEGDRIASGDFSIYLAAEDSELAYLQDHLEPLALSTNLNFDMYNKTVLEDTSLFTVFGNEGVRTKIPYTYMYKDGEIFSLDAENVIHHVYFMNYEALEGNTAKATQYYLTPDENLWNYITFEVDVEEKTIHILDEETVPHLP